MNYNMKDNKLTPNRCKKNFFQQLDEAADFKPNEFVLKIQGG